MEKGMKTFLVVTAVIAFMYGIASAEQTGKDWYGALRLGFQPYTVEMSGKLGNRDFDSKTDLSDILDKTDTIILGGELEFGKGRWFTLLSAFYQNSEAEKGDTTRGAKVTFEEIGINAMVGYRVYQHEVGPGRALSVDAMAGVFYVKADTEVNLYSPILGNVSRQQKIDFLDPMVGARLYFPFTKKFGIGVSGQIGGFGVGSELQYVAAANLVYNFTDWFALSAGYKYWYWKWEDDGNRLSELEQKIYGPTLGVQFKF